MELLILIDYIWIIVEQNLLLLTVTCSSWIDSHRLLIYVDSVHPTSGRVHLPHTPLRCNCAGFGILSRISCLCAIVLRCTYSNISFYRIASVLIQIHFKLLLPPSSYRYWSLVDFIQLLPKPSFYRLSISNDRTSFSALLFSSWFDLRQVLTSWDVFEAGLALVYFRYSL